MQFLDYRTENDIQLQVSPTKHEKVIPTTAVDCLYCRQLKTCIVDLAKCSYLSLKHTCKLP